MSSSSQGKTNLIKKRAPGAGKNTACDKIIADYGYKHFSTGDLLRAEVKKKTEDGVLISSIMAEGKIVPVKISCGLLKKAMDETGEVDVKI